MFPKLLWYNVVLDFLGNLQFSHLLHEFLEKLNFTKRIANVPKLLYNFPKILPEPFDIDLLNMTEKIVLMHIYIFIIGRKTKLLIFVSLCKKFSEIVIWKR